MAHFTKLEFVVLDISGKNYLPWTLDAEIHLTVNNLGDTIKDENKASPQEKAKAMIFLRHNLHEDLTTEYLTVKDPLELWKNLKERYDHQKQVFLPKARYEWIHLRLQDFKSMGEYNFTMFSITSQLKLCGEKITDEDMLEKNIFHILCFEFGHAAAILGA
jgi:gag-polypeptide of LTR copia-type